MDTETILEHVRQIPGWMSEPELTWLIDQAAECESWLEIGMFCGRSLAAVALALPPHASLMGADINAFSQRPRDPAYTKAPYSGSPNLDWSLFDTIRMIVKKRPDLVLTIKRENFDSCPLVDCAFIDAGHTMKETYRQISNACFHGGRVCGHDYNCPAWPGVSEAIELFEACSHRKVQNPVGSIWELV